MFNFYRLVAQHLLHVFSVIALLSLIACSGEEDKEPNNFDLSIIVTGSGSIGVST